MERFACELFGIPQLRWKPRVALLQAAT
jgi:hypothetical protein